MTRDRPAPLPPEAIRQILETPVTEEGLVLQRGGEALPLHKVGDRFTVSFNNAQPIAPLLQRATQSIQGETAQVIPGLPLAELQVETQRLDAAMQTLRNDPTVAYASHVYRLEDSPDMPLYLTDRLTVQFAHRITAAELEAIATTAHLQMLQEVEGVPHAYVFRVMPGAIANPIKLANRLMELPEVLTAEPDIVVTAQPFYRPTDSLYPQQWYLQHDGGLDLAAGAHISVEAAWDVTRGSRAIVVAVIDDAFDLNHPDFQGLGKIVAPTDLRGADALPLPEAPAENHGTAVAGVAIAAENGQGIVGVAPGCAFMPIRYTGMINDDTIANLFKTAVDAGADVISCSWGAVGNYFPLSLRQRAAIAQAATQGRNGRGCVVVFAAGNANRPVNATVNEGGWPDNLFRGPTRWLNGFAVHPDVIAVSACTSLNKKSAYSNWGAEISVTAPSNNAVPGVFIPGRGYLATAPAIQSQLPGRGVLTSDRLAELGYARGSFTDSFGGTSSACPVVAGVAALVLSANPDLTAIDVRQILETTADKIVDQAPDPQLGLRRGSYDVNGHSEWFGYGRVNAQRAVEAAQKRLMVFPAPSAWIERTHDQQLAIPDDHLRGVRSVLQVAEAGLLRDIQVDVEIEHPFLGDLEVVLRSPLDQAVKLQGRTLGRQTHLATTYTPQTASGLRQFLNQPINGIWQLQITDHVPGDTGRLLRWRLRLGR
ncbi:MAG: S8 family serine peptidase [Synechococcales bacterium]|nr:S8 family serine peptidase [Synechococcales bacterium]